MIVELSATQFLGLAALAIAGGVAFGIEGIAMRLEKLQRDTSAKKEGK